MFTHLKLIQPTSQDGNSFPTVHVGMHEFGGANSMFVGKPTMLLNPSIIAARFALSSRVTLASGVAALWPEGLENN